MADLYAPSTAFFNKPSNASIAQLVSTCDVIWSGYNQQFDPIHYWSSLTGAGFNQAKLGWYGKFDNGHDPDAIYRPGSPESDSVPNKNTIAWEEVGDMLAASADELAADSSDWPLLYNVTDATKNPPYGWVENDPVISQSGNVNRYIHMDIGKLSYRLHFKARVEARLAELPAGTRPKFLWLDNGRDNPFFTGTTMVPTKQYPEADGSGWFAISLDWVRWLILNVCVPNGLGLAINYQTTGSALARFDQFIDVMALLNNYGLEARVFVEFFTLTSSGNLQTTLNLWKMSYLKMKKAEGRGVICDCCVQVPGDKADADDAAWLARIELAFATWLLGMGSRSTIRYSQDNTSPGYGHYGRPPVLSRYRKLGQPTDAAFEDGSASIIRRNFANGYARVNYTTPTAPTYTISVGVGDPAKIPLVTQTEPPNGWKVGVDDHYRIWAKAMDGGTLAYTLVSGSLPTGKTLNASTGWITGAPTATGSGSATIRTTETGGSATGGYVETSFSWSVAPGDPVPTPGLILALAYGSAVDITLANGDVFKAANAAILTAGTIAANATGVLNGDSDTTTAAGLTLGPGVPDHYTTALFNNGINNSTNPGAVVTITGITAPKSRVQVGILTGSTPAGRIIEVFLNGVSAGTIDFNSYGTVNYCYVVEYQDINTSSGTLTIEVRRASGASVSSRVMNARVIGNRAPVIATISPKPLIIGAGAVTMPITITNPDSTVDPTVTLQSVSPSLPGDWTAVINDTGTGTANLVVTPGATGQQTYSFTIRAADGTNYSEQVVNLNTFSTPTIAAVADFSMKAGQTSVKTVTATSPSGTPALSMTLRSSGDEDDAWLDRFVTLTSVNGYVYTATFHPEIDQTGVHELYFTFTDEDGNQATEYVTVTVTAQIVIEDVKLTATGSSVGASITITANQFTRVDVYVEDDHVLTALAITEVDGFSAVQLLGGTVPQIAGWINFAPGDADIGTYNAVITITNSDDDTDTYDLEVIVEAEADPPDPVNRKRFDLAGVNFKRTPPKRPRLPRIRGT